MNSSPRCQRRRKMDKEARRQRKDILRRRQKSCIGCGFSWRSSRPYIICTWTCLEMFKLDSGRRRRWKNLIARKEKTYPARTSLIFQSTWEWWKTKWKWRNSSSWRPLWKSRHSSFSSRICIQISAFVNKELKMEFMTALSKMKFRSFSRACATWSDIMIRKSPIMSNFQKSRWSNYVVVKMNKLISYTLPTRIQCRLSFNLWWMSTYGSSASNTAWWPKRNPSISPKPSCKTWPDKS